MGERLRPEMFGELWAFVQEIAPRVAAKQTLAGEPMYAANGLGSVGLFLNREEGRYGYDSTPLNADTFAHTGGDGVHYSFMRIPGEAPERQPVVMTVPMAQEDAQNFVLGADLREFLSLGCRYGYFALEQLAYDFGKTARAIEDSECFCEESEWILAAMRERFGLSPWKDVHERLRELRREYWGHVQIADGLE